MDRLDRAMRVLRNLPAHAVATQNRTGQIAKDELRNRALKAIDVISKYNKQPKKVDRCIKEAWAIYKRLQNLVGPFGRNVLRPHLVSGGLQLMVTRNWIHGLMDMDVI